VDDVRVVGLTPQELVELIAEKLKPFVSVPKVTVAVPGIRKKQPPDPRKSPFEPLRPPPPLWPFVIA
jgi:hypothetical protein